MSEYKPGTVAKATVRGQEDVLVVRTHGGAWVAPITVDGWTFHGDSDVTDVRPLVLLDLEKAGSHLHPNEMARGGVVTMLLDTGSRVARNIADQIEAQTKPPRIPEPGLWGVVEDHNGYRWVRHSNAEGARWHNLSTGWTEWSAIEFPTLVREGVES